MSRIAIICEGDADREIIKAVLDHYLDDYVPVPVQPPTSAFGRGSTSPFGLGWKGVRLWCQQEAHVGGGPLRVLLQNNDLVVVHVDADVAKEHDGGIDLGDVRCPPPSVFSEPVRAVVLTWLGLSRQTTGLVLCVPAMATEAWALVSLFPESISTEDASTCIECDEHVKQKLRKLGKKLDAKLVTSDGGRLRNHAKAYADVAERITAGWRGVVTTCSEAARFDRDLERWLRGDTQGARR